MATVAPTGVRPGIRRIGLTGGIGSGKSTVARLLAGHGVLVVDTDAIARALTAPGGAALPRIARAFGTDVVAADGALDRERMRERVFADAQARQQLEAILHPMIGDEAAAQAATAGDAPVVFDVPLLAESRHWRARVDRVLVVDCPPALQVARVVQRSGWTVDAVERVIAQQMPRAQRRRIGDAVIDNGAHSTLHGLAAAVATLAAAWLGR